MCWNGSNFQKLLHIAMILLHIAIIWSHGAIIWWHGAIFLTNFRSFSWFSKIKSVSTNFISVGIMLSFRNCLHIAMILLDIAIIWSHGGIIWSHVAIIWAHGAIIWSHGAIIWSHAAIVWSHIVITLWEKLENYRYELYFCMCCIFI